MRRFVLAVLLAGAPCFGAQAEDQDISDALKKPAYNAAWSAMLKGQPVPGWLTKFTKNGDGVTVPSVLVEIDGVPYEADHVCKPHDCAGNEFEVLFAPEGKQAWGALVVNGKPPRFFGAPNPKQMQALQDQLKR
jgi:hypothetical protein